MPEKFDKAPDFDFDEWAQLYREDPVAFEARRQAVLALEIAKAGPAGAPAKRTLQRLEHYLEGKSDTERMRQSMVWMVASMRQLSDKMTALGEAVGTLEQQTREAAATAEAGREPRA